MKLTDIERKTIVGLEYEKSLSFLKQIDDIAAMNFWDTAVNRMYYAIFHAVLALLINDGYKVSTHKGTMSLFGQYYVKTGKFTADEAWLYTELQSLREKSDYNCVYVTTEEEMRPLIEPLKAFIAKVGNMIKEKE